MIIMCSSMFSLKVLCILWVAQCAHIVVNKKIRPWGVKQLLTRSLKQCKVIKPSAQNVVVVTHGGLSVYSFCSFVGISTS